MKRVYIGAPWWADYLAPALYGLQHWVDRLTPVAKAVGWAQSRLERCREEKLGFTP